MSELIGKWNYYFLRYGAGTLVGAVIVVWLAKSFGNYSLDEVTKSADISFLTLNLKIHTTDEVLDLLLLAVVGFTFCYIASAPGTVFHAARGLFWKNPCCHCWWIISLFVICLISFLILISSFPVLVSLAASIAFGVIVFQIGLLIGVFFKKKHIQKFYSDLANARSKKSGDENHPNGVREYVESYRHLREHGNAFEIMFLEFLLLAALLVAGKDWSLLILALWVLPAAFCWVIGTVLEFGMMGD